MTNAMQDINALLVDDDPDLKEIEALLGGDDKDVAQAGSQPSSAASDPDPSDVLAAELKRLREDIASVRKEATSTNDKGKDDDGIKLEIPELDDEKLGKLAKYKGELEAIAKHATGDTLKQVTEELNRLRAELKQTKEEMARKEQASFATTLRTVVPDLDELHRDPKFAEYLKKKAPYTGGLTLAQLLEDAYENQDLQRAREIIEGFRSGNDDSGDLPSIPGASARPPVRGRGSSAPASSEAPVDDQQQLQLLEKLNRLYQQKKISYMKFLDLRQKLEARFSAPEGVV